MPSVDNTIVLPKKRFLRDIADHYPITFSILLVPALMGILFPFRILRIALAPTIPKYILHPVALTIQGIIVAILLLLLGWWKEAGFTKPAQWRCLYLNWVLAPLILPTILFVLLIGPKLNQPIFLFCSLWLSVFIGFSEESLFRGIILHSLKRYGAIISVLVSSFLFSLMHITNLMAGFPLNYIYIQLYVALSLGVLFGALRIRTGTIWIVIILHSLIDFIGLISKDLLNWSGTGGMPEITLLDMQIIAVIYTGFIIIGLFLLRSRKLAILPPE
ncbi:MAG: lysostaphin resistance A-like protein [bacterium]